MRRALCSLRVFPKLGYVLLVLSFIGCAGRPAVEPQHGPLKGLTPAAADARAEAVRANPLAYVRRVAATCRRLRQYTVSFVRYERRGLFNTLYGPEHIRCWFRRQPFSVRMKWLDENLKYNESVYIRGQPEGKVRFVTRWWVPPLLPPPAVNVVDLQTPVIWGESKRPLSDFGLEALMDRTLESLDRAGDDVVATYEGLLQLTDDGPTVHHLRLEFPASLFPVNTQELYFDVATDLPAGTVLKFPSGTIDAAYYYFDVDTHVRLTDTDFVMDAERATRPAAASQTPASRSPATRPTRK